MSRVHDALRRAEQQTGATETRRPAMPRETPPAEPAGNPAARRAEALRAAALERPESAQTAVIEPDPVEESLAVPRKDAPAGESDAPAYQYSSLAGESLSVKLLSRVREIPFEPDPDSYLVDWRTPQATPSEEFRSLRTRLNHLQASQRLHTLVVSSPSPAEGKTFTSTNLALAQSHLAEKRVLLADFDLRRPLVHTLLKTERAPGLSDYLLGKVPLHEALRKVADTNLYLLPAGSPVKNPLELLNLQQVKALFDELPDVFHWSIIDTPPLLFSADANLLATLTDGTLLVVKIGETTFDNVIRAMQSLCENTVLGIVANGARASELYSKYTYYYSSTS